MFLTHILLGAALSTSPNASYGIDNLRCEYMHEPLGIDTRSPRLTWRYTDPDFHPVRCRVEIDTDSLFSNPQVWEGDPQRIFTSHIPLQPSTTYHWRVTATDAGGDTKSSPRASFETGLMRQSDWQAIWITDSFDSSYEPAPVMSKSFILDKIPASARAYVSAVGYYDMRINGKRVGKSHMDPGFTRYDLRNLYATHDITPLLQEGKNMVEITLGNGFANCQSLDAWGQEKAPWRTRPLLLCQFMADGKTILASDSSWLTSTGEVEYNNIYSGDHIDHRTKISATGTAIPAKAPSHNVRAQEMPPIMPVDTIRPTLLRSWGDTVFLFDMHRNIAGVCRLDVKGRKGTHLALAHGELLKDNGRLEQGNLAIYYHPLKADEAFQTDRYILDGDKNGETFQPQFSYHGFRYAELRSDRRIKPEDIRLTGLHIRSGVERRGYFRCSDPVLNGIYDATMLSYENNIHSIPTDCPQREKNGWTADAHVAMDLALLNYDGIKLYEKWLDDFSDNQLPNGNISGIIPSAGWGYGDSPGPVWDAALFIVPLAVYDYYGDKRAIEKLYPSMLRYFDWLRSLRHEDGTLHCGIGDWLPYSTQTPTDFTTTLYAYADFKMMARVCDILGLDPMPWIEEAEYMAEVINSIYFDEQKGLYANGSQAAQGIALYWGVVPSGHEQRVADNLDRMVRENGYALDFGLLGSKSVLRMLTRYGHADTAFKMATRTEAPSWGHMTETMGHTTLGETWVMDPGFRDASLDHVFFGDIAAWMTSDLAGLNYDPTKPGFENIIINPHFPQGLDWAEASINTPQGVVSVRWERLADGTIALDTEIPPTSTACFGSDILSAGKHRIIIGK